MKYFVSFFLLLFLISCGNLTPGGEGENVTITADFESNSLDSVFSPYKAEMEEEMNEVLGYADTSFIKHQPESYLGDLVADIVYAEGREFMAKTKYFGPGLEPSMALINFGGLRATIDEGPITKGDIFSLMPFDNLITVTVLQPNLVKKMLKTINDAGGQPVSNCRIRMSGIKQWLFFDGEEYLYDKPVYVITSDYLAGGGDKMSFFKETSHKVSTGVLIRNAIIDYVQEVDTLRIEGDLDRIHIVR
ncbi:MAG: 5'-nucleotidase C-terminal domain-containing protein [Crocinitomicaceae bacterium]|nr:5'-nucleotidase C-terminal domain-containing protein [Crocinitomicaceae bacterium]